MRDLTKVQVLGIRIKNGGGGGNRGSVNRAMRIASPTKKPPSPRNQTKTTVETCAWFVPGMSRILPGTQ